MRLSTWLFLLFVLLPLAELAMLMVLADWTNWKVSLAVVIITGVIGAGLMRHQGLRALSRIRHELRHGRMPGDALVDSLLIVVAGALLLTPGVLTDAIGIVLLIPFTRPWVKSLLYRWWRSRWSVRSTIWSEVEEVDDR